MRSLLLARLGSDLTGRSLLDAGCGTGALAVEAARRGARVTAVDVAGNLVSLAAERAGDLGPGEVRFAVGDMLDPAHGAFDHAVAMDSLIHYPKQEIVRALAALAPRVRGSLLFTFAPATPALTLMHAAGGLFPRADRAPAIEPVSQAALARAIAAEPALQAFALADVERVQAGFYISHALELRRR
jgi:magnesium-protoporphyrin O-methyltransferase